MGYIMIVLSCCTQMEMMLSWPKNIHTHKKKKNKKMGNDVKLQENDIFLSLPS